jgi:hypothetical protein
MPYIESVCGYLWNAFKNDKKLLEKQLGIPIINEYGASELDLIAFQSRNTEQREWESIQKLCLLKF